MCVFECGCQTVIYHVYVFGLQLITASMTITLYANYSANVLDNHGSDSVHVID